MTNFAGLPRAVGEALQDEPVPDWVHPELVAQTGFTEWTRDGKLRHPRYQGLRTDKDAADVVRETR